MSPLALIPLSAAVGIGFLGAILSSQHHRDLAVRIFAIYCAMGAYLCFVDFQLRGATTTREAAEFWLAARCLWPFALTLLLHFLLLQSQRWQRAWESAWSVFLYLPAVVVTALYHVPDAVSGGVRHTRWGWDDIRLANAPSILVSVWVALVGLIIIWLGVTTWLSSNEPSPRRHAKYIALGTSIQIVAAVISDGVLPSMGIPSPPLSSLGTLACAILISHAMRKLKLFVVSPEAVAELIVSNMSDLLLLCDADGKIQRTNKAALFILGCSEQELVGKPADEVLPQLREPRARGVSVKEMETSVQTASRNSLTLSLSASSIRNADGRLMGMLFIGRDISDRKRAEFSRELLVRSMIQAQDEERRRIARELHDEIGQVLGSLIAELRVLEDQLPTDALRIRLGELRNLVTRAMQEVQRISRGMHPGVLDALGLAPALQHYAEEFARRHGIQVTTEILGFEQGGHLPPEVETTVYRIVQEALTNVARHAQAKVVSLFVLRQEDLLRVIIEDDGKGFDSEAPGPPNAMPRGLGLVSIRERVNLLGGTVRLETALGEGVTLKIELPSQRADQRTKHETRTATGT